MHQPVDNTPYWAVDPYRWDIPYINFYGRGAEVTFGVSKEATVQHLLSAIRERGSVIYIGFCYSCTEGNFEEDIIRLAQFGTSQITHASVWFGEHVTTMAVGGECGVVMTQSPLNYGRWELAPLPFTNVPLAFRIGVDIVLKCNRQGVCYRDQRWTVFMHMMKRLLTPGFREKITQNDYDPDKPETWSHGVHCSQLTLLFLKRCVLRGALYIAPRHRERFLNINSFTCLPASLRALLAEVWVGRGQFRDYRNVGEKVWKAWYPHYWERKDTELLK